MLLWLWLDSGGAVRGCGGGGGGGGFAALGLWSVAIRVSSVQGLSSVLQIACLLEH